MTQTATTITVDSLPIASTIDAVNDRLLIYTNSAADIQGISRNVLLGLASQPLGLTDTQSPTNKTFGNTNIVTILDSNLTIQNAADNTKQANFSLSGNTTSTVRTYTLPNYNATLASRAGIETLTNKTLTAPVTTAISNTGGLSTDAITVTGNETVGGTLGVTGNTTLGGTLSVTGTCSLSGVGILPSNLDSSAPTAWVWQAYSPSFTNFTAGDAVVNAEYTQIGTTVHCRGNVILGSTSSMGSNPEVSLPVTSSSTGYAVGYQQKIGGGSYTREGVGNYLIDWSWVNSTTAQMWCYSVGATYVNTASVTSTVPNTWTSGDNFTWQITYEAAT